MKSLPAITPAHGDSIAHLLDTVQCVDAFDLLTALPDASVDMVLCDLPYGVTACKWDTPLPLPKLWDELRRVTKTKAAIVLTATQPFASRLVSSNYEMYRHEWVWIKEQGVNFQLAKHQPLLLTENVLVFSKTSPNYKPQNLKPASISKSNKSKAGRLKHISTKADFYIQEFTNYPTNVLRFQRDRGFHPTQKPVALFEYLIKTYTRPGEVVLDMTCGSGTTAVAARKTGRRFICGDNGTCERTGRTWAAIARERLQQTDPYQPSVADDTGIMQRSLFEVIERDNDGFLMAVRG